MADPVVSLTVSVGGGAPLQGGVACAVGSVIQLSATNKAGWGNAAGLEPTRWELRVAHDYATPSGWTSNGDGSFYVLGNDDPPTFTVSPWGKYAPRVVVAGKFVDESTMLSALSPTGVSSIGIREGAQFGGANRRWLRSFDSSVRVLADAAAGVIPANITNNVSITGPGDLTFLSVSDLYMESAGRTTLFADSDLRLGVTTAGSVNIGTSDGDGEIAAAINIGGGTGPTANIGLRATNVNIGVPSAILTAGTEVTLGTLAQCVAIVELTAASSTATLNRYHRVGSAVTTITLPAAVFGAEAQFFRPTASGTAAIAAAGGDSLALAVSLTNGLQSCLLRCTTAGVWDVWLPGAGGGGSSITTGTTTVDTAGNTVAITTPGAINAAADNSIGFIAQTTLNCEGLAGAIITSNTGLTRLRADGNDKEVALGADGIDIIANGARVRIDASGVNGRLRCYDVDDNLAFTSLWDNAACSDVYVGTYACTATSTVVTANTKLTLGSTTEIELNGGLVDINGTGAMTIDCNFGIDIRAGNTSGAQIGLAHLRLVADANGTNCVLLYDANAGLAFLSDPGGGCKLNVPPAASLALQHNSADRVRVTATLVELLSDTVNIGSPIAQIMRHPPTVTPPDATILAVFILTVPANSSGRFVGSMAASNGFANDKQFEVAFDWTADATTVNSRNLTRVESPPKGTIAVIDTDITRSDAGLVITISVGNGTGIKCGLRGIARVSL